MIDTLLNLVDYFSLVFQPWNGRAEAQSNFCFQSVLPSMERLLLGVMEYIVYQRNSTKFNFIFNLIYIYIYISLLYLAFTLF